jgi:hypothetical protein
MKRIITFVAVLAAGAIAASPALGDDHARDAHARAAGAHTGAPIQDAFPYRETPDRIDRFGSPNEQAPKIQPGQPTWPVNPQPLTKPASAVPVDDGGSDDGVWLLLGGALVVGGIVGAGVAGMARRQRLRARRVAV